MRTRTLLCVALGAMTAAQAADRIVGGPYVVNPAAKSVTIGWIIGNSGLKTGDTGEALAVTVPVLRCEKVSLSGLKPGKTVHYEVPNSNGLNGHFKTPPAGKADFQFVVFGDTRTRHDLHRRVIGAVAKTDPDFVIHTGDLVQDGYDTAQWPNFFDIEAELLRKTVFYPVLGNHERNNARFHEFFDVTTPYYSFDWGSSHFIILNSDVPNVSQSSVARAAFWEEQTQWLEADLARSQKADFRFVAMHHPPFTVNSNKGGHVSKDTPTLVPMFEKYKVTAVLAGHDHNYQRHVKDGIQYIITGGGGAPLADVGKSIPGMTQKVESIEHFVQIRVSGTLAHLEAIALDGRIIEQVDLGQ